MLPPSPSDPAAPPRLAELGELVRRLERDGVARAASAEGGRAPAAVATGWVGLDGRLGTFEGAPGLARGALHEWVGLAEPTPDPGAPWSPPLTLLAHLAARALDERLARVGQRGPGAVLWIGRSVWPYAATLLAADGLVEVPAEDGASAPDPQALAFELGLEERPCAEPAAERALFARSLLVDPRDTAGRLWAVDAALRCPTVTAVVADATGFDMAATRRLALAANAGEALALLARPPRERAALTAAATRWSVTRSGATLAPRWRLDLTRAKPPQRRL